jgi:hypothetical protein
LDEPLPTITQLQDNVKNTYKYAMEMYPKLTAPTNDTLRQATDALVGLPLFAAEQSTAMCLTGSKGLDVESLWDRKRQIIGQTPGLSVWTGKEKLSDIGGLNSVKTFINRLMTGKNPPKSIIFIDEIEKAFAGTGTDMSGVKTELTGSMLTWMQDKEIDGMIFIGIPGVSKSQLSKATGGTYGTPVINFDLAGMQSGIVGSSGANLRSAQKTVDAISGNDGGSILAIATCNSITALPPELRRRFNLGIFFFDAPTAEERTAIWDIYTSKYELSKTQPLPHDEGWTGAEIKECCKKAYRLNISLIEAGEYIVPVTVSARDQVESLRYSCSGKYLSASNSGIYTYGTSVSDTQPVAESTARKIREM